MPIYKMLLVRHVMLGFLALAAVTDSSKASLLSPAGGVPRGPHSEVRSGIQHTDVLLFFFLQVASHVVHIVK